MQEFTKYFLMMLAAVALAVIGLSLVVKQINKSGPTSTSAKTSAPPHGAKAQAPDQTWQGELQPGGGIKLRLVLKIWQTPDSSLTAKIDSLDQNALDLPIDTITLSETRLQFEMKKLGASYEGTLNESRTEISGAWKQGGASIPLNFKKSDKPLAVVAPVRPQEPKKPYPYLTEDVTFENASASLTLAGTLTLPKSGGPFPVAVMISGSGPQNRDEALLGHRPFLVIADYLTRRGIAVLRYDDRGVGKSTGDFSKATSLDFATDVRAAIGYLKTRKEINSQKIGLIGHSEGGLIAPIVAADNSDLAFIVLMAGPGVRGDEILKLQSELISKAEGVDEKTLAQNRQAEERVYEVLRTEPDNAVAEKKLREVNKEILSQFSDEEKKKLGIDEAILEAQMKQILSPWFRFFLTYDPKTNLEKVKCPILAMNGENDLQVPTYQNLPAIAQALDKSGNSDYTIVKLPKLNHLFQTSQTGAPSEYAKIEETIAPSALQIIGDWIVSHTK
jgi:hypothetical protein